jgi:hypothetical protein
MPSLNPHHPTSTERRANQMKGLGRQKTRRGVMSKTDDQAVERMRQAIANYAGPVTQCPPGKARATPAKKKVVRNASVEWLKQNRNARPIRDHAVIFCMTRAVGVCDK